MTILINYLERISTLNNELKGILGSYVQDDMLDQDIRERLASDLKRLDTLPDENPKIMLYGMYNAGKSSLLNALFGKEIAQTGDYPVTKKVQTEKWKGWAIVDTPGIDVTGPEELVTEEELKTSNVVIFVISYGDIDHGALYKKMQHVYKSGKKLIIALNCKDGINQDDSDRLRSQIMMNMERVLGEALKFSPYVVSASHALLGKQEHDQNMIDYSRIEPLEKEILNVVRSVDGFSCFTNYLNELKSAFEPYQVQIQKLQVDDSSLGEHLSIIDRRYREFNGSLSNLIKGETFSLSTRLLHIASEHDNSASANSASELDGLLSDEIRKFDQQTMNKVKEAITTYIADLAEEIGQVTTEFNASNGNTIKLDPSKVAELASIASTRPDFAGSGETEASIKTSEPRKRNDNSANIADILTDFSRLIPKNFVTPPIGPIPPIPLGALLNFLRPLTEIFAGNSSHEHEDAMVEEQVKNARAVQMESVKMREQWRHEIKDQCDIISMDIEREEIARAKEWIKNAVDPIRQQTKAILADLQQNKARLIHDNERLTNWFNSVDNLIAELKSR